MHRDTTVTTSQSYAVQQADSTATQPSVLNQELFSPEDELILFAVLQDIARELRRIKHERKKHQTETEH